MGWFFSSDDSAEQTQEEYVEEQGSGEVGSGETTQEDAGGGEGSDDSARNATIVRWADRLMITKGYGWSKAMDAARDLYGE